MFQRNRCSVSRVPNRFAVGKAFLLNREESLGGSVLFKQARRVKQRSSTRYNVGFFMMALDVFLFTICVFRKGNIYPSCLCLLSLRTGLHVNTTSPQVRLNYQLSPVRISGISFHVYEMIFESIFEAVCPLLLL